MEIYFFNITVLRNRNIFEEKIKDIDEDRVEKISRLKVTDDRLRSLGAGLLINFIRNQYGIREKIQTDKFGKLHFENEKVHFNISHSGNYVIAAVSDFEIGIDIQRMRPDKLRIAEKNFLPKECEYINEFEDDDARLQRFCEIWTIKEAYLKNKGIGLRKPLNSFEVDLSEETPRIVGEQDLKIVQFKLDQRYIISVCASVEDQGFQIEEVNVKFSSAMQ